MFKHVVIEMTGRFCACQAHMTWDIGWNAQSRPELIIACTACGLRLVIPHNKFLALIRINGEYQSSVPKAEKLLN